MALAALSAAWAVSAELSAGISTPSLLDHGVRRLGGLAGARLLFIIEEWHAFAAPMSYIPTGAGFTWYGGFGRRCGGVVGGQKIKSPGSWALTSSACSGAGIRRRPRLPFRRRRRLGADRYAWGMLIPTQLSAGLIRIRVFLSAERHPRRITSSSAVSWSLRFCVAEKVMRPAH
jgi:hypothetical protein